jgi:N6-L-threonylcarbamoyladenine synthase
MIVLGIETSCDETSVALVADGRRILSNVIASQMTEHARYGGVVPELASRRHVEQIVPVLRAALAGARCTLPEIDAIAVTNRPGLLGALLVGVSAAKALAMALGRPLVGVHHIEAHFTANLLTDPAADFPAVALVVSGGHTDLFHLRSIGDYTLLGRTRDDAAGEAFDKCARLMGLGYPGGPAIQEAARSGDARAVAFPRALLPGTHEFSFSGLKNAVRLAVQNAAHPPVDDLAASFQEAVVDVLVTKTVAAARAVGVERVFLAGGVASSERLREKMRRACESAGLVLFVPPPVLCTDNGAMIAGAAYWRLAAGYPADPLSLTTLASESLAALAR